MAMEQAIASAQSPTTNATGYYAAIIQWAESGKDFHLWLEANPEYVYCGPHQKLSYRQAHHGAGGSNGCNCRGIQFDEKTDCNVDTEAYSAPEQYLQRLADACRQARLENNNNKEVLQQVREAVSTKAITAKGLSILEAKRDSYLQFKKACWDVSVRFRDFAGKSRYSKVSCRNQFADLAKETVLRYNGALNKEALMKTYCHVHGCVVDVLMTLPPSRYHTSCGLCLDATKTSQRRMNRERNEQMGAFASMATTATTL